MFQLSRGGLEVPMTTQPEFSPTPFPDITMPMYTPDKPTDFTNAVKSVAPINMNTIKGVSGKTYENDKQLPLPPISSGSNTSASMPTLNNAVRGAIKSNLPSYIPSDTYGMKGVMDRDWEDFSDVQFYVGIDGKYYSTDPFFNQLLERESTHRLNVDNGSHRGPAQMGLSAWTEAMPGVSYDYAFNPEYAGKAAVNYAKQNIKGFKKLGIPVNALSVYAAHNLGPGNARELFRDLDAPLTGKLRDAIMGNFNDAKTYHPELFKKYIRDPNSITRRDYLELLRSIFKYR